MNAARSAIVQSLTGEIRRLEKSRRNFDRQQQTVASTGIPALDRLLPHQGLLRGTLAEWTTVGPGTGALTLATLAAQQCLPSGPLIVIDPQHSFYPAAAALLKVQPDSLTVVRPCSRIDALWALEQSLRCRAAGAVLSMLEHISSREYRRLQLAAEHGSTIGLLVRCGSSRQQATWADVRFRVDGIPVISPAYVRRLKLHLLHAKGCYRESTMTLDICDDTGAVRVVSELPCSAISSRAAGA
jgi:hypothetical protein